MQSLGGGAMPYPMAPAAPVMMMPVMMPMMMPSYPYMQPLPYNINGKLYSLRITLFRE